MSVAQEKSRSKIFLGSDGNALVNLIVVIALTYLIFKFIYVIYIMSELQLEAYFTNVFNWFVLPANISKLSTRPWTLLTYMFTHERLFHMVANLLWLWLFGYIMQELTGNRKLVPLYLYGGLAGAVVYIAANYLIPSLQGGLPVATLLGANASVMAIAVATTASKPDYRIFPMIGGGIPLWIIMLLYAIIDFSGLSLSYPAVHLSHLAGAGMGFLFITQLRKGNDWSEPINAFFDWMENLFNPDKPGKKKVKDEFFYKVRGSQPYKKTPNVTQQRIDEILDKINQQGYHFLTDEEKEILRRAAGKEDL